MISFNYPRINRNDHNTIITKSSSIDSSTVSYEEYIILKAVVYGNLFICFLQGLTRSIGESFDIQKKAYVLSI